MLVTRVTKSQLLSIDIMPNLRHWLLTFLTPRKNSISHDLT
jgi:hypothetical protein